MTFAPLPGSRLTIRTHASPSANPAAQAKVKGGSGSDFFPAHETAGVSRASAFATHVRGELFMMFFRSADTTASSTVLNIAPCFSRRKALRDNGGMARTEPQINIRIPVALKGRLEDAAKANKRSVTAELLSRLESTFESGRPTGRSSSSGTRDEPRNPATQIEGREEARAYVRREEVQDIVSELAKTVGAELREELRRLLERHDRLNSVGSSVEKSRRTRKSGSVGTKGTGRSAG